MCALCVCLFVYGEGRVSGELGMQILAYGDLRCRRYPRELNFVLHSELNVRGLLVCTRPVSIIVKKKCRLQQMFPRVDERLQK